MKREIIKKLPKSVMNVQSRLDVLLIKPIALMGVTSRKLRPQTSDLRPQTSDLRPPKTQTQFYMDEFLSLSSFY